MRVLFDAEKNAKNLEKYGISLARAVDFDFDTALFTQDNRMDYGEVRWSAVGFLDALVYVLVFTDIEDSPDAIRAISLRNANKTEQKLYAKAHSKD